MLSEVQEHIFCFIKVYQKNHSTHVTGPVAKSSAESENNEVSAAGTALAHFKMMHN